MYIYIGNFVKNFLTNKERMKIRIKYHNDRCRVYSNPNGDWIDLRASKSVCKPKSDEDFKRFESIRMPLGISMELPPYFEAIVVARSSSLKNYGFIVPNGFGVIDNTYCGDEDEWCCLMLMIENKAINAGDRICQFRIQPSQFAPWWIKLKWLFNSGIKFIEVNSLNNYNRGGFGQSGKR